MIAFGRENYCLKLVLFWVALAVPGGVAFADGSETLGPPSIPIASGTAIFADGTGMLDQPGLIELTVPNNATVKQVLLYWNGFGFDGQNDDTVTVGGVSVTGTLIGGPDLFFDPGSDPAGWWYSSTFRADITNLGLVGPGSNAVTVADMEFNVFNNGKFANNGAGIIAIIEEGSGAAALDIRDGNDIAWIGWPEPRKTTVPQTFSFVAAPVDRTAKITMFFAAVAGPVSSGGPVRPSVIEVKVGGTIQEFNNQLGSFDGPEWDTLVIDVNIPAGATSLTVQALSEDRTGSGFNPASYVWLAAGLSIPTTASLGDRVWEDLNGDGLQNCTDGGANDPNNLADGIIGNAGDAGPECDGVANVRVRLRVDNGDGVCGSGDTTIRSTTTDANGFYLFDNLEPGGYCLAWTKPTGFDCTEEDVQSNAFDAIDSDGTDLGTICRLQDVPLIDLQPGEDDRTWDLGLVRLPPPVASLGDRVWEDLDADGIQDCSDDNANGILGDGGDSGPECGSGIPNVPVELLAGDCSTPLGQMVVTDATGFYLFENLPPGDYCVDFGLPPEDFCDTDGFDLGGPVFTGQNSGSDDAADSDADAAGISDPTSLSSGDIDRTIDAGVYCPAKIGDFVFFDENENGRQDLGEGGVPDVKTTLFECGPDMIAGTGDDVPTGEMRVTGDDGMYMYGAEDNFDLPPGKYFVQFDPTTLPLGFDFTTPNVGSDDLNSDCLPPNGITACTDLTASRAINLARDCGIVPPPPPDCNLFLDKSCRVEAPPPQPFDKCDGKLQEFTLIWTGAGSITASGPNNSATLTTGDEVTFVGPFSNNDVIVDISGAVNGQSEFHVSCSDDDFNDPSDCGKLSGNGKGNDPGLINAWRLEGFVDADGRVLDCTADSAEGGFSDNCAFVAEPLPSCDNGPKPDTLTWRYDGGTDGGGVCANSTFFTIVNEDGKAHSDFECTGAVNTSLQVTAVDDDGNVFMLNPGDSFTTLRDDIKTISLTDSNGATQDLVFHTSCSQPLEAQATAGALTLAGLDDRDGAQDVTYRYEVINFGDPLTGVAIEDDPLGTIASGLSLGTNGTASFDKLAQIFGTTVNTAQASGVLANGEVCAPTTAFDSVVVETVVPPCSIGIKLDKVEDDKLKIKLTNSGSSTVTMDSLTVSYPAARGVIEKIKLNGDAYKFNDSANPVLGNPANFGPTDWTEGDVGKRQIKPGDTKTLEIESFEKSSKDGRFEVTVDFGEGCMLQIVVENQAVIAP